jgi:hypothetical protein
MKKLAIFIFGFSSQKEADLSGIFKDIVLEPLSKDKDLTVRHSDFSVPEVSFYDIITSQLRDLDKEVWDSEKAVLNIIHNTDDIMDSTNLRHISKFLGTYKDKLTINFFTNVSENQFKSLDFGVLPEVYSGTSAGIKLIANKMTKITTKILKG